MTDLASTVRETMRRYRMVSTRDTVLVAVSGGPDSVCMLHILLGLREEMEFDVKVAHLDHQFRGEESRRDAEFVAELADRFGVPCFCHEENVPRFLMSNAMSAQDAARILRYQFLVKTSKLEYCQRIATGHNADDQAETVLMRVLRGAGPDGLAGIPPKREGIIIRPILGCWREEIERYLEEHDLPFRIDESNMESKYLRNEIRNDLLPSLERYNPQISRSLVNLGSIMADVSAHFDRLTDAALPEVLKTARVGQFVLDLTRLAGYDEALQRSVFRRAFESLRPDLPPLASYHVEKLLSMLRGGDVGASVELPDRARARIEHGCVVFSHGDGPPIAEQKALETPGTAAFADAGLTVTAELLPRSELGFCPTETSGDVALFDWNELSPPLNIRARREGDRFQPFGMEGTQSVKDFFVNSKIAFSFRPSVPLLCDETGVLWVVGIRRSARAPVTDDTEMVLAVRACTLEGSPGTREDTAI
jgi:tRNA(Ile)-lysidine synthase